MITETLYKKIPACVKYKSYVFPLGKNISQENYNVLKTFLKTLGQDEPEYLGVMRVRGDWGFLDYPSYGFIEFKVNFYKTTSEKICSAYLQKMHEKLLFLLEK